MIQIVAIVLCAAALAMAHKKKIEDFLAPVLMTAMLFVYCGGILHFSLRLFSYIAIGLMLSVAIVCIIYVSRAGFSQRLRSYVFTPAFSVCVVTCVAFCVIFSTHKLMHWDDLSYWGIYVKDIFCLDRLPLGVENCTISYKDYPPIQQIMQYFFMFMENDFNEPVAFCTNVCFLYILMLPFLSGFCKVKSTLGRIGTVILYLIFPHIFTTQFYYKLGLDFLISVLFGYGIYLIIKDCDRNEADSKHIPGSILCNSDEVFRLMGLIIVSSYLAVIKTSGGLLTIFLTVFYAVRIVSERGVECKKSVKMVSFIEAAALSGIVPICAYLTWKLWGRRTGNHGYLSDIVTSNVKSFAIELPPYAGEVTLNYIKHVFTYPLTREKLGVTAFVMMIIIAIMYHVRKKTLVSRIRCADKACGDEACGDATCGDVNVGMDLNSDDIFVLKRTATVQKSLHITMCIGIFVFCVAHLYMYLFVFDDWEAFGLLEFDRYINQYLAGVLFVYLYDLWGDFERFYIALGDVRYLDGTVGDIESIGRPNGAVLKVLKYVNPALVITVFLAALMPYPSMGMYLIPSRYDVTYTQSYEPTRAEVAAEWDACALKSLNLPLDEDHRVMLVGNAWTDQFQFLTLEMVPQAVTVATNAPALAQGEICDFIADQIVSRGIEYIYVMNNADADYPGDIAAESIEKFGVALECGQSYYVDRSDDEMTFVKL